MGTRTTTAGHLRSHGDWTKTATPGVSPGVIAITGVDATLASTVRTNYVIPPGAIPLTVDIIGGGTGGTSPLVDVGVIAISEDGTELPIANYLVDGAAADSNSSVVLDSATAGSLGVYTFSAYKEYVITLADGGGTNATGGTIDVYIWYSFNDADGLPSVSYPHRTTTSGYRRAHGDDRRASTAAPVPCVMACYDVDATLPSTQSTGCFLPKGAVPLRVDIDTQSVSGGTSPLVDVGLALATPDPDGLVDGAAADADSTNLLGGSEAGALLGTELTETAEITVSDGGGTNATAGLLFIYVWYTFADDGKVND